MSFNQQERSLRCPKCKSQETGVKDSRPINNNSMIRRRRRCRKCQHRWNTYEVPDDVFQRTVKRLEKLEPVIAAFRAADRGAP